MAKRKRLEAPGAAELADIEAGFAAKPVPDRMALTAPISQIAAETAAMAQPLATEARITMARDTTDATAWRLAIEQGRVVIDLPLDSIDLEHLIRDRMVVDASDMEELKTSIRAHGLRLPIEVVALADARYGLVSGWRRVTVLRQLRDTEGGFHTVKAIIRAPYEAGAIYTAMVEENELRSQLTPYERGRIAVLAAQQGAFFSADHAIDTIYAAASKAKRSKIRSFALVHEELGDMLRHPTELSERNGLRLAYALREGFAPALRHALMRSQNGGPAMEWAVLDPVVTGAEAIERTQDRSNRPRVQVARPVGVPRTLANGMTMERVLHDDGYSIRLRGKVVDAEMVDLLMEELNRLLARVS